MVIPMRFVGDTPVIMMTDTEPAGGRHVYRSAVLLRGFVCWHVAARQGRRPYVRPDREDAGRTLTSGGQSVRRVRPSRSQRSPPSGRILQVTRTSTRRPAAFVASTCVPHQGAAVGISTDRPPPDRREGHRARGFELRADEALAGAIGGVGVGERQVHRRTHVAGPRRDDQSNPRDAEHEPDGKERDHRLPGSGPRGRADG